MKKEPSIFIGHILECLELIEGYAKGMTKEELSKDELRTDAIVRRIEIIGEAAKNIPNSIKKHHPTVPWRAMAGMRDIIVHQYYGIEVDEIWGVIKKDAPRLKKQMQTILKDLESK